MAVQRLVRRRSFLGSVLAVAGPAAATGIGLAIGSSRTTAAALIYLLAVVCVAAAGGLVSGIASSTLSFLGLNYFFTPPRRAFSVAKADDLVALVVFLSVGMVVSTLVALGLAQRARAERREYETRTLDAISSRILGGDDPEAALREIARVLRDLFGLARCEVQVRAPGGSVHVVASEGNSAEPGLDIPLSSGDREVGSLILVPGPSGLGDSERRVAEIFARQTAAALQRVELERAAREARLAAEAHRVRRALLSAVSHDFRTPLASIKAAITALRSGEEAPISSDGAQELLQTALEETERLERLVSNLLDLTRIRSGSLAPDLVSVPVEEVMEDALRATRRLLADHRLDVMIRPDVPPILADPVQMGQVFRNVLENAARFAPPGSEVRLTASRWHDAVEIRIADRGDGIPAAEREAVFEEFYRSGDSGAGGSGLGLALARAIVHAHRGKMWVEETPGGGATLAVRIPAGSV